MNTPVLRTKLHVPPIRPEWVARPRLIERLNTGSHHKLTLVSAPAGFGKTTLLGEWVHSLRSRHGVRARVAWLSLDEGDDDPVRFWTYFITALQTVYQDLDPAALETLHAPRSPAIENTLVALLNEVSSLPQGDVPCTMVLDDYHVVETRSIHDSLAFFIDHLPPLKMRVVVASRTDPPLPLPRLRARRQLTELRTVDLRFTLDEVTSLLNRVMGLALSPEELAAIESRTEGWVAGLQLAALSMQGLDRDRISCFISAFSGSHHYVLDYLLEEVFQRQPAWVRDFLLRTAIPDRLTGSLCDALLEGMEKEKAHPSPRSGQEALEWLERANLFILPLDGERRWYRYHGLFTGFLRNRLEQESPHLLPILHHRCSEWFEGEGLVVEAVSHALLAGEVDRVARLVEKNVVPLMNRGELATLMRWIDALPESRVRANPWLSIARIWAIIYAGSTTGVEPLIREVEGELRDSGSEDEDAERERIAGHVAALRAYLAYLAGNAPRAVQLSNKALQILPEKDADMRGFLMGLMATMLRWSDDIAGSMETLNRAVAMGRSAGDSLATVEALCEQAMLRGVQGRLHEAFAIYREALEVAEEYAHRVGRQLPITGYVHTRMSQILRQWNDLESADYHIQRGIELCEQWGQFDTSLMVYIGQTLFLCALGDREGALDACRRVKQIAEGQSPWYRLYVNCFEAQLQLALGNVCAAVRWAEQGGFGVDDELEYVNEFVYITLSRVLIAQGRFNEALYLLERLLSITQEAGRTDRVIVLRILQAVALEGKGQAGRAVDALEQALSLAEPEGYVRAFVDEGAPMVTLLESVVERGRFAAYAQALLDALQPASASTPAGPSPLIEPLSGREREVLAVLALGHSNREIAETLGIATGTVKNHLKNVYGKLGVHSRTQAVRRATELGILKLG